MALSNSERSRAWRERNRDRLPAIHAEYRAKNSEGIRLRKRIWRKNNPDKARQHNENQRAARTPAAKECFLLLQAKWRKANPGIAGQYSNKRRAAVRACGGENYVVADIVEISKAQRGLCAHPWCKKKLTAGQEVDHILPIALGGSNGRRNIQLLCRGCNRSKGAKHPIAYAQQKGMLL